MINSNYVITKHAKDRLYERGINVSQFIKRDLLFTNVRNMITTKDNYQIRYTKNNLKIVMYGNKVVTVFKIRGNTIKKDMEQYRQGLYK